MPVSAADATAANAETLTRAGIADKKLANDFSDFLTLLTTQLQNQDPLDPMDSGEFTQQLVAFSGVEQQIQTNQNLENLAALTQLNNIGNVTNYLGYDALVEASFGDHTTDGIKWQYSSTKSADDIKLQVLTEDGDLIYEQAGNKGVGLHDFVWNGKDKDGNLVDPGNYELKVVAKDADGAKLNIGIAVQETITAVNTAGNVPTFTIGPNTVPQSDILSLVRKL